MSGVAAYTESQRKDLNSVVDDYLPLVKKIALHLIARLPAHVELDDLLQVGLLGLLQAKDSYDASQGASFGTYASFRIKGAMLDEVRRNDWAPRSVQRKMKDVSQAIRQLEGRLGRSVTDAEIAAELNLSLDEYYQVSRDLACSRLVSLDELDDPALEGGDDPFSRIEGEGFRSALMESIQLLPEKEMLMMSLYYTDGLNLKEVGEVLGVSESRVSQIHGQALARIRTRLSEWVA
ncbi:MAG: RNA polymerase sigma factor FliA [Porticoccaceae bacterium]|nr:RNA polymerase sigma factor FliA [Pseudomonadales bacterium]MCP5173043.1 RNA polymerase sigma factor FliA [Pseudomonadales bacterium]MCP5302517.1 RNA polymerase sigma factor FliA [Pseudomonadales bacterium]